jgi:protein-S-isoprenylcysteine O-methyltransferase Ste14
MRRKRYESPIFTLMLFVLLMLGLLATALDPTGLAADHKNVIRFESFTGVRLALLFLGLAMILAGVIIRFIAIFTLKRNFSGLLRIREGHTLVSHGIYQWVRHPAYLGAILLFLGIPVMFSSVFGFLVMFLLVPYLLHRITLEERMMIERFGVEYQDYVRHSKKLIPFLF